MFQIYPERPGCYWSLTNWIWQVDAISQLYRSRHDKAGTTKVALVKATKHKADPATNEIRVENRNHGLVGSQSGNNKTVQTLLSFIITITKLLLLPRKEIRAPVKRLRQKTLIIFRKTPSWSLLSHNAILHS